MNKVYFRYFSSFFQAQENWLNNRAKEGYQLIKTTQGRYFFTTCKANEYEYRVEFIADKTKQDAVAYKEFLEELGYRVFYKNLNLTYSFGKVKWRPYAKGQFVSSGGRYNKELLIIEKKVDGIACNLHSDREDRIHYYKNIRRMYTATLLLLSIVLIGSYMFPHFIVREDNLTTVLVIVLCSLFVIPIGMYSYLIYTTKKERKIYD